MGRADRAVIQSLDTTAQVAASGPIRLFVPPSETPDRDPDVLVADPGRRVPPRSRSSTTSGAQSAVTRALADAPGRPSDGFCRQATTVLTSSLRTACTATLTGSSRAPAPSTSTRWRAEHLTIFSAGRCSASACSRSRHGRHDGRRPHARWTRCATTSPSTRSPRSETGVVPRPRRAAAAELRYPGLDRRLRPPS